MKIALKSIALCTFLFNMVHNECSSMQAIADEIRKGERERRAINSSGNPSSITSKEIPETTTLPSEDPPRGDVAQSKILDDLKNATAKQELKTPQAPGAKAKSPPKTQEFKEKIRYVGGQRIVTPGKKPEGKK